MAPPSYMFHVFLSELHQRNAPPTIGLKQTAIYGYYDYLVEHGAIKKSPIPDGWRITYHHRPKRELWMPDDILRRLVSAADSIDAKSAAVVRLAVEALMKTGEITGLDVEHVEFDDDGATIKVPERPGSIAHERRVSRELAGALRELAGIARAELSFLIPTATVSLNATYN